MVAEHLERCRACESTLDLFDVPRDPLLAGLSLPQVVGSSQVPRLGTVLSQPATDESWPALPGYEILGMLGEGGMGVVYRARQVRLNRLVALKHLRTSDDRLLARAPAEAESLAQLQHPNIVQIHEVIDHQEQSYLALELVEGGTLAARLTGKPQPARRCAEWLEVLARAVHYAHEHGIVHRDLKPANVLLTPDGVPKITDFGVAKRLRAGPGETLEGDVIGTAEYMAPEQAAGKVDEIGPASDIYSLGIILYEMLTGHVPLQGPTSILTLMRVAHEEPIPPRQVEPRLPRDLETICLESLHKEPRKRYASAGHLADDLRRFLNGEPIQARPPGPLERLWRWCRDNPIATGLFVAVILGAVVGFWHLSRLSEQFVRSTALTSASMQADMLETVNARYSQVVDHFHGQGVETPTVLPVPATFLTEVGRDISAGQSGMQVRHYSDHPFRSRRDGGPRDDLEREALARLRARPDEPFHHFETYQGRQVLRYFTARRMRASCVDCHNRHADSTKRDWRVGDVRGVLEIVRPLDDDIARTHTGLRGTVLLMGVVSTSLLAVAVLVLLVGRRRRPS
jgi:serine/threonine protein kinase